MPRAVCDATGLDPALRQDAPSNERELLAVIAAGIERRVGRQRFAVWFVKSARLSLGQPGEGDVLVVVVANDFVADWIRRNFDGDITAAAAEAMNATPSVRYEVDTSAFEGEGTDDLFAMTSTLAEPAAEEPAKPQQSVLPIPPVTSAESAGPVSSNVEGAGSRLRHDLDDFLIGTGNKLAAECCRAVAETPGTSYNPLFIHGSVGLGKTHLLQGLCRRYAKLHPTSRWAYFTAEEFTNGFVSAVKGNRVDAFRRKLRDVDLLVIDDVHFLAGKRATQEEFLHTFNAIEAAGRHVVMASDAHPKTIASFGESLISRFVSGMVARIDPPSREMREQLLRELARRRGLKLGDEVIGWIARRVTQNVRELEGAVNRIAAHVELADRKPDVALAQEILFDLDRQMNQPIRAEQIFAASCDLFGLDRRELMSGSRQRTISVARSLAMFLTRKLTSLSYPEIASRMGKRNHSTVISACRRMETAIKKDEPLSWSTSTGERTEPASELAQRLEDLARVSDPE
ncbi:MAG: chromosomal replication initiator protein DnaA [Planctomycetota bacterium]